MTCTHHVLLSIETLLLPELKSTMAPEDHYHRLMSALSEAGPFEETQRLYHLGIPSHGMCHHHPQHSHLEYANPPLFIPEWERKAQVREGHRRDVGSVAYARFSSTPSSQCNTMNLWSNCLKAAVVVGQAWQEGGSCHRWDMVTSAQIA